MKTTPNHIVGFVEGRKNRSNHPAAPAARARAGEANILTACTCFTTPESCSSVRAWASISKEKNPGRQLLYRQFFRNIEFSICYRGRSLLMIGSGWDKPAAAIALHHSQLRK